MNDSEILELYRNRDEGAIEQTEIKYGRYCESIAFSILSSVEDSEECANDTYMKAWNSIPPNFPEKLCAYLGKITRNLAIDRLRSINRGKRMGFGYDVSLSELEGCIPTAEDEIERLLDAEALSSVINSLLKKSTKKNRFIFIARYFECKSISAISAEYGISTSAVKSALMRMRVRLHGELTREGYSLE